MPPNRNDFTNTWLGAGAVNPDYTELDHRPLRETAGGRADILIALTQAIVDHHTHLLRVRQWIDSLGFNATKAELDEQLKFEHNTKMGNFGEVVASEILIQQHGYTMPIFKLRYRDSGLPMRGEDIIAFGLNEEGEIDLLVVGEGKAYTNYSSQAVKDALKRLTKAYTPHPQTLNMIAEILYGMGREDEAKAVDQLRGQLTARQVPQEHWIFFITGDEDADPFGCINQNRPGPRVICVDLPLTDIQDLVNTVFTPSNHWEDPDAP